MQIIVGLGNPGKKYTRTRHNTGFLAAERLKSQFSIFNFQFSNNDQVSNFQFQKKLNAEIYQLEKWLLIKPQTFMNHSGEALTYIKKKHPQFQLKNLYVIHDDLDIPLGEFKIQFGKGPRQHGGINSIEQHLKTKDFWRVRIGVRGEWYDRIKASTDKTIAEDYLLKPFTNTEWPVLNRTLKEVALNLMMKLDPKTNSG